MRRARSNLGATLLLVGLAAAGAVQVAGCATGARPDNSPTEDAAAGGQGGSGVVTDAAAGSGGRGLGGLSGGAGGSVGVDAGPGADAASDATAGGMGGAPAPGIGGASGGCSVALTAESPPDLARLEAFPGAHARVSASARGNSVTPVVFTWEVLWTGPPSATVATTADPTTSSVITFPVDREGQYRITPHVAGEPCRTMSWYADAHRAVFLLRATADGFPAQETTIKLRGVDPQDMLPVTLDPGVTTQVAPLRPDGSALPSFVRVSSPSSALRVEGETLHGFLIAQLSRSVSYDVLVVPDENIAPALFTGTPDSLRSQALVVDQGIPIHATVSDGAMHPLAGARMILRNGVLPSTVGTSDTSGLMTLWARAGRLSALLVPPVASGLPLASVDADAAGGIVLPQVDALDLRVTWDPVVTAPVTVEVLAPDGSTRLAGAQVRATSARPPSPVATLWATVGGFSAGMWRALGSTDVQVTTNASGVATFPALPVGDLTITVVPPPGPDPNPTAGGAVTAVPITVAPDTLPLMVTLARKVILSGVVLPAADSSGALITGIDTSITAPGRVVTATVDAGGHYSLQVDPARTYQLIVDPVSAAAVSRAALGTEISGNVDKTVVTRTLPAGHLVVGTLAASTGGALANAHVQVFCPAWSLQCLNPNFALADAVPDRNGRFQFRLPAPVPNGN